MAFPQNPTSQSDTRITRIIERESLGFRLRVLAVWLIMGPVVLIARSVVTVISVLSKIRWAVVSVVDYLRLATRVVIRHGMPIQIVAFVTARCNLRCQHCFYKETLDLPDAGELPLDVFDRTTKSIGPLLWFSLGGGEPFVRRDLDKLVEIVQKNCRPKVFSFPTNGWYVEQTFETTLRILKKVKMNNLILFFSIDGPQEIHDRIRGPHSFERVKATMERLRPLTALYPHLHLNVVTTVTTDNCHVAQDFIKELVHDFKPSAISINLFRYHSLKHPPIPDRVIEGYRAAVNVYHRYLRQSALKHYSFIGARILLFKEFLQRELIYRVAKENAFVTPCTAGTLSYVIMEDGRISPCEILPDSIGNISKGNNSFIDGIRSPEARKLRRWIRDTECKCTYECAMSTNTLFSWPMSKKLIKAVVNNTVPKGTL